VHQCKPAAGADTTAEAVNGVFEDTADGIVALSSISIAAAKEIELSFKWSAAAGSTATPVHQCKPAAGADTTAEAVNGVFEDTADGIVALSSISIAAAKEMELSFKLSAAAGSTATPVHQCKPAAGDLRIPPIEACFGARFPKEMEISKAFLDLLRSAAKKNPE
jgi:molybdopterin-binding protein